MAMGLHEMTLGFERSESSASCCNLCGPRQIHRVTWSADIGSSMAHRSENFSAETGISGRSRHPQCLNQVALSKSVFFLVVGHPSGEFR